MLMWPSACLVWYLIMSHLPKVIVQNRLIAGLAASSLNITAGVVC